MIEKSKYSSRLTQCEVEEIRVAPLAKRHAELARQYGVTPTTVARIRRGITWPVHTHDVVRVRVPLEAVAILERASIDAGTTTEAMGGEIVARWAASYR
ncbi:MAG: hypothetical protein ABI548_25760 [Polyangiaceae bacterium]